MIIGICQLLFYLQNDFFYRDLEDLSIGISLFPGQYVPLKSPSSLPLLDLGGRVRREEGKTKKTWERPETKDSKKIGLVESRARDRTGLRLPTSRLNPAEFGKRARK